MVSPSTRSVVHAAAPIAMRKSVREAAVIANEARKKITGDGTKRPQKVCAFSRIPRATFHFSVRGMREALEISCFHSLSSQRLGRILRGDVRKPRTATGEHGCSTPNSDHKLSGNQQISRLILC